jgi:hypothetical protein
MALCVFCGQKIWKQRISTKKHPPYSPDLVPSDIYLFGPLKHHFSGERFPDDDAVERAVRAGSKSNQKNFTPQVSRDL